MYGWFGLVVKQEPFMKIIRRLANGGGIIVSLLRNSTDNRTEKVEIITLILIR
jgi:hypothetical protein